MRSGSQIKSVISEARSFSQKPYELDELPLADGLYNTSSSSLLKDMSTKPKDQSGTIDVLQKKLFQTRSELDELRTKYGALKRNYDSVSHHSAKDSVENVRLGKMRDEYEN